MTGTDTVGGALRAAVERVHHPRCKSCGAELVWDGCDYECPVVMLRDLEMAAEAADVGALAPAG